MTEPTPLDEPSLGWLRYLHRKATTPDDWSRGGQPHPHWDDRTGEPMLSWHRFDLVDSAYSIALMADRTPAWREVYGAVLNELVVRHTDWWAASDWLTQFGPDPDRNLYPENWRTLIPETLWGDYDVPGWTANGIAPYGVQMDPIAADGSWSLDVLQGPIRQEGLLDGRSFSTSGLGARSGDDRHFVEYDSYVLDEDRVR